jgi:hypothetical protein
MAELHCDLSKEQNAYCKISGLFGKCASEIKTDIDLVYGTCPSISYNYQVYVNVKGR